MGVGVYIPNLIDHKTYRALAGGDIMVVQFPTPVNKTLRMTLDELRTYILTNGGASHPPVIIGGNSALVKVGASQAGQTIYSIPDIAGKNFTLRRIGVGAVDPDDYEILNSGGFKLVKPGDVLTEGEQFELQFYNTAPPGTVQGGGSGSIYTDFLPITGNKILTSDEAVNKICQIRAPGNAQLEITLPLVEEANTKANRMLVFETMSGNIYEHTIKTQGQNIYYKGETLQSIFIGAGRYVWLWAGEDGYYIENDNFSPNVGKLQMSYFKEYDELYTHGQPLLRTAYPTLFRKIQTFTGGYVPQSLKDDPVTGIDYRGCYGDGDGSTTFTMPDTREMMVKGLKSESGTDTKRNYNRGGGFQKNRFPAHFHPTGVETTISGNSENRSNFLRAVGSLLHKVIFWNATAGYSSTPTNSSSTDLAGEGDETIVNNIGQFFTVKYH